MVQKLSVTVATKWLLVAIICLFASACGSITTPRIVIWHTWNGDDAQVINRAVERFSEIFEDAHIVTSFVPESELIERYETAAAQGLGPDLFIASSTELRGLAESDVVSAIAPSELDRSPYYSASISALTYKGDLYGIPLSMRPLALYYNTNLVDIPATTLNDLLAQAQQDISVAINSQFSQTIWGIQAFGGQILDEEGRVVLNEGAFTNWLNWLLNANSQPEIFLSRDAETLRRLFIDERVAYYTGSATELALIRSLMEPDSVGVVPLPAGPNGAAGPIMEVDALMLNPSSSQSAREVALRFAQFLTNLEQANIFMRDLGLVPTNRRVRVDLRTYPAISGFIAQTRSAVAIPNLAQVDELIRQGDDVLLRVLEGVLDPNTAAQQLTASINAQFGLTTVESQTTCDHDGEIALWHSLTGEAEKYLTRFIENYKFNCPEVAVAVEYIPLHNLIDSYLDAFAGDSAPDMLLTSTLNLQRLVEATSLHIVAREDMQAFSPVSQDTVSLGGDTYGFPIALTGNVFYYNQDIVSDSPVTTDELLTESDLQFTLSGLSDGMLWTLTAYNGFVVNRDIVVPDLEQLTLWLDWIERVHQSEHIRINANRFQRISQFERGDTAYYVGSNMELAELTDALGGSLTVSIFPTGTSQFASPLVTSLAVMISAKTENMSTAEGFAEMLTHIDEQENMVTDLRWIPANTSAVEALNNDPNLSVIADILRDGSVINDKSTVILTEISRAMDQIFTASQAPNNVAEELFTSLTETEVSG